MEGYEPGVTELEIRFDGEEDKGKITVGNPVVEKITSHQDIPHSYFNNSENQKKTLYLCANDIGEIKIKIDLLDIPFLNNAYVGILEHDIVANSKLIENKEIHFDFWDDAPIFDVVLGYDNNNNNKLDYVEIITTFPTEMRLISRTDYNFSYLLNIGMQNELGIAGELLGCFLLIDEKPFEADLSSANLYYNNPSLSHPVGAKWDTSGKALIRHFIFNENTSVAKNVATDSRLINNLITFSLSQHNDEILEYFNNNPEENENIFGPWNCRTESGNNIITFDSFSLKAAFGHVVPTATLTVRIVRNESLISANEIWYNGHFTDIYDFDYLGVYPAIHGATIQLGYNIIKNSAGEIFKTTVHFDEHLTDYNYIIE